jgi:hypothetical protein
MTGPEELSPLHHFARNVYSQSGEDGIIEEVLGRIRRSSGIDGWCVEFGAWDGIYLSNTCNLISNHGYKAVLIEGDRNKYRTLCTNLPQADVHKICAFVGFDGESTLENILAATPIPGDFDFLSIDIDGCDYFILDSLRKYRPKVISIEFNPTIPNEVCFVQPRDFRIKQGASAKALTDLAKAKGYALAAVTACNLIFVRGDLSTAVLGEREYRLEMLRDDSGARTFLFAGYDGTVLSNRDGIRLPWHGMSLPLSRLQPLPRSLRRFPSDYNVIQKILLALLLAVTSPSTLKGKLGRRLKKVF